MVILSFVSGFIHIETTPVITIEQYPLPTYWQSTQYILPTGEIIVPKVGEVIELEGIDSLTALEQIGYPYGFSLAEAYPWKVVPKTMHAEKNALVVQYRSLGFFKGEQFIYSLIMTAVYTVGKENRKFTISTATPQDLKSIIALQEQLLLRNNNSVTDIGTKGFLVNRVEADSLLDLVISTNVALVLVAKNSQNKVIGYSISYDGKYFLAHNSQWPLYTKVPAELLDSRFLYGKHLASDGSAPGIGSSLNASIFQWGKENGYTAYVGEICEGPIVNQRSLQKHVTEQDFTRLCGYTDSQGFDWGVYEKKLL